MYTLTTNGSTHVPNIPPGTLFTVAVSGTFASGVVSVQYPLTGPTQATLAVNDGTESPGMTLTAATAGLVGNNLRYRLLAATATPAAAITHAVTNSGEVATYTFSPRTTAGTASSLTTSLTGDDNDLVFTARTVGTGGDAITVEYVDPSANDAALSVDVTGDAITVNLATDSGGTITSTANEVRQALIESADAMALVSVAFASSNDGSGVVTALAATNLAGGVAPAIASTTAELAAYINAHCAGAFTAALETDGAGVVTAQGPTALAGATAGTFATYAGGDTGTFAAAGERAFVNVGEYDGINLLLASATGSTSIKVSVLKSRD